MVVSSSVSVQPEALVIQKGLQRLGGDNYLLYRKPGYEIEQRYANTFFVRNLRESH